MRFQRIVYVNAYRFSKNVLPLTAFLPMAVAFQAKYAPEGSDWYRYGRSLSQPQISRETPNGRTPLNKREHFSTITNVDLSYSVP